MDSKEEKTAIKSVHLEFNVTPEHVEFFKKNGIDPATFVVEAYKKAFDDLFKQANPSKSAEWWKWAFGALGAALLGFFYLSRVKKKKG